jgi:hypothetical protein
MKTDKPEDQPSSMELPIVELPSHPRQDSRG